ncbi:MAG TPA: SURF1 family protein [Tianweitania sediminis]|nr:SURF1 family protein [Tianweitania sediminis]
MWVLLLLLGCAAILVAFFCALGIWQVERRAWKLDLIERVEARINAPPVAVPPPAEWNSIDRAGFEYRRVEANGRFMAERTVFVQAVTSRGGGFWVVTPLQTAEGFTVLVNRGFVSSAQRAALQNSDEPGETSVTGLLRLSEPGGGFLRSNDPAGGRWFSRDVAAISEAQGLSSVAPYFIDAEAVPDAPEGPPLGGLTVVSFNNNHLVYALTWFGLALMALAAAAYLIRDERRLRRTQR